MTWQSKVKKKIIEKEKFLYFDIEKFIKNYKIIKIEKLNETGNK